MVYVAINLWQPVLYYIYNYITYMYILALIDYISCELGAHAHRHHNNEVVNLELETNHR